MNININTLSSFIIKFFFIVLLLELFLLGSGQFLSINGISLRMLFYFIAIAMSIILLINGKRIYKEVFSFFIVNLKLIKIKL